MQALLLGLVHLAAAIAATAEGGGGGDEFATYDHVPLARGIDEPPPRQIPGVEAVAALSAPQVINMGHDFAALHWTPRAGAPVAHRVYTSQWLPSFTARYAPDLSGVYVIDGETVEVCAQRDGILGEGRLALYLHSSDGGFSALGTARWDVHQGGYAGVMVHSNDTMRSGPMLLYAHSDGWLRLRSGWFHLDPNNYPQTPTRHADVVTARLRPKIACAMLPPAARDHQADARELTGRYFSNYNESLVLCSANGSLLVTFSGLGYVQGFASGKWVPERQRWEGIVAEIGSVHNFAWEVTERGELTGVWQAYNRTWGDVPQPETNDTTVQEWRAWRDRGEQEQLPTSLAQPEYGGQPLDVEHFCSLLAAADSGQRPSLGDVADEEVQAEAEREEQSAAERMLGLEAWRVTGQHGLAVGFGGGFFEMPQFEQHCRNETLNLTQPDGSIVFNVTTVCTEDEGAYDVNGFYRRAPHEQRFAWMADKLALEQIGAQTKGVVAPLVMGATYIFRVVALYREGDDQVARTIHNELADLSMGQHSAYSTKIRIVVSGPGAPLDLTPDRVGPTSMRLRWSPPPFNQTSGLWHSDGGARLIGYRVYMRQADVLAWQDADLVASTADHEVTLHMLRPQTLFRIFVVAENIHLRGLHSLTLSVATSALRATLWTECDFKSTVYQPLQYQGCFRDLDSPPTASIMRNAPRLPDFTWQLSADLCARVCEPALFFGLRDGGRCMCGSDVDDFGHYGAVEDSECDRPCTGEPHRECGGFNRTSVYRRAGTHGVMIGVGSYHSFDLIRMRLAASSLSSVQLPEGLQLTLFSEDGHEGISKNLTVSVPCLQQEPCPVDHAATKWAEPKPRCEHDVWDDQTVSLRLSYVPEWFPPRYTPRPSAETGARAFALGTAGVLARFADLGGDIHAETVEERPYEDVLTQYTLAPRLGDGEECAQRVGTYSSDRICLQPTNLVIPELQTRHVRRNPYNTVELNAHYQLQSEFTDEFARLKRQEWRQTLRTYARPFYVERLMRGSLPQDVDFEPFFATWFASIRHIAHLLSKQPVFDLDDDSSDDVLRLADPVLGLDEAGEVVPWQDAAVPPLPEHPFPKAEERGDGIAATPAESDAKEVISRLERAGRWVGDRPHTAGATTLKYQEPSHFETEESKQRHRFSDGPVHDATPPYAVPTQVLRENYGRNPDYDRIYQEAAAAAGVGANGDGVTPEVEEVLFGTLR